MAIHPTTKRVYEVICEYINREIHPTYREIAEGCHMATTSILRHVDRLEGMGWIVREEGKVRSIRLGAYGPNLRRPKTKKRD